MDLTWKLYFKGLLLTEIFSTICGALLDAYSDTPVGASWESLWNSPGWAGLFEKLALYMVTGNVLLLHISMLGAPLLLLILEAWYRWCESTAGRRRR